LFGGGRTIPPPRSGADWPASDDGRTEDGKRLWTGPAITGRLAHGLWPAFLTHPAQREAVLSAVLRDGVAVLHAVPCRTGAVVGVGQNISIIRETSAGQLVDIRAPDPGGEPQVRYRASQPATALPFRDPVPTLKLLHCLQGNATGGESTLVDGFQAAARFRLVNASAFRILATTPVTFTFSGRRAELRATRPVIDLDPAGRIREVRFAPAFLRQLRLPPGEFTRFENAHRAFAEQISREDLLLSIPLQPGDCLLIDNTRILTGRASSAGDTRHFQACWADLDALSSTLAMARRSRAGELTTCAAGAGYS
jgi:gamma-butyrobetaine dioxygenase